VSVALSLIIVVNQKNIEGYIISHILVFFIMMFSTLHEHKAPRSGGRIVDLTNTDEEEDIIDDDESDDDEVQVEAVVPGPQHFQLQRHYSQGQGLYGDNSVKRQLPTSFNQDNSKRPCVNT
jgi:hypothetical protein